MADSSPSQPTDPPVLRLAREDNVGVATRTIEAGEAVTVDGRPLVFADRVPMGHKVALVPITAGEKVSKYGAPIGSATRDIHPGQHVHTHNLASDYLPS